MSATFPLVVAEPIEVEHKRRRRIRADHDFERVTSPHSGVRAVAFDPGTAVLRLGIHARMLQQPIGRTGLVVLGTDEIGHPWSWCGEGAGQGMEDGSQTGGCGSLQEVATV